MPFATFERIFKSKYPNGTVVPHGQFGGTEGNKKTAVIFKPGGRVYEYCGAYDRILSNLGFKVINKARVDAIRYHLNNCYNWHLKEENLITGELMDCSVEIAEFESQLKDIEENYIIV